MAAHLDQPIDYDAEFTRRVIRDHQHLRSSVTAFALAVVVAIAMWAMFLRYI